MSYGAGQYPEDQEGYHRNDDYSNTNMYLDASQHPYEGGYEGYRGQTTRDFGAQDRHAQHYEQQQSYTIQSSTGLREICLGAIHQGYTYDGVSRLCFDTLEESIWTGSMNGTVYQHVPPGLEFYSSITAHNDGNVLSMCSLGGSVASLSAGQFCVHASGCAPRASYLDTAVNMSDFFYQHWNHQALIGRLHGGIITYDVIKNVVRASHDTPHGVVALAGPLARGQLVTASADGYITLFDPRKKNLDGDGSLSDVKVYSNGFSSLVSSDNLVASSGYGGRPDRPALEPMIRVFDPRMNMRMISTIPYSNGPSILKFHPKLTSTLLVCSPGGMFSILNVSGGSAEDSHYVDMGGDTVVDVDISSTGDCIVFGGAHGYLHLWASFEHALCTHGGASPEYPPQFNRSNFVSMDDSMSFSIAPVYMPADGGTYASDISEYDVMKVGLTPRRIDGALLATGKLSDFVTYIHNPKYNKGDLPGKAAAAISSVRNKRIQHRRSGRETEVAIDERASRRAKEGEVVLPKKFRRAFIKQQTGTRYEEFDFKQYNHSPFSGLENNLANCYMNALIQALYFTRPLRDLVVSHIPDSEKEFTLLGELSLLFRMLGTKNAERICQASNLLRALRQTSEAVALGLLEGVKGERGAVDIAVEAQKDKNFVRRMERLNRFILTRLEKEENELFSNDWEGNTSVKEVFGLCQRQRTTCLSFKKPTKEQEVTTYQIDLKYPSPSSQMIANGFEDVLGAALNYSSDIKAWFDEEVGYQPVRQERSPSKMPQIMATYTGLEDISLFRHWKIKSDDSGIELPSAIAVTFDPIRGSTVIQQAHSMHELNTKLPQIPNGHERTIYLLSCVISYIHDKDEAEELGKSYEGHFLSHVRIPPMYRIAMEGGACEAHSPDEYEWMTFNDFHITSARFEEVQNMYDGQKIPVLLYFTEATYLEQTTNLPLKHPRPVLTDDAFLDLCKAPPIQKQKNYLMPANFIPLSRSELPQQGTVFALDAEFVAYSAPEKQVVLDADSIAKNSRLGLGRVSLVRGDGTSKGVPCMDDYIHSVEPVYDHLTRYSGLVPGDLDIDKSAQHLTTLRRAYLKLRYLVDAGCIFVGHGLKKDFRMLNIVVPSDQVIDTVDLYHSGKGRRLSLKFLSSFFLGNDIQGDTHDSIEDATAALKLYELHKLLVEKGTFKELLQKAYEWGGAYGWDPSTWEATPPPIDK